MDLQRRKGRDPDARGPEARGVIALVLATVVAVLALRGMTPAGAGVFYDDGVYLALAKSLAEGGTYTYANLPGDIAGVKYPPLYPALLAGAWKLSPAYPGNLGLLKGLNAVLLGLAAALAFLAFTAAWRGPRGGAAVDRAGPGVVIPGAGSRPRIEPGVALGVFALACLLGFGSAQSMVLATALLSEPLFLVTGLGALLLAGRRNVHPVIVGFVAALCFLARGIGISVVAAVFAAELLRQGVPLRRRFARLGLAALGGVPWMAAWVVWSRARAGEVPDALAGQYGGYVEWFGAGAGSQLGRLREVATSHWHPFLTNLEMLWIPDAAAVTANFVLAALGLVSLVGLVRIGRRNPALALFPILYLLVVFAWPYEPDRFFYAIIPVLTLVLAAGGLVVTDRIREDLPRWGGPAVAVVAGLLLLNSAVYEVQAHAVQAWTVFQRAPAAAYDPLNRWISENTSRDDVVASGLDPLVYWSTGRLAVPSFQFLATDYGRYDASTETLAGELGQILAATKARWIVVIRGEGKAGATMAAFAELRPDRARLAHEAEAAGVTGEVWEVVSAEGRPSANPPSPR